MATYNQSPHYVTLDVFTQRRFQGNPLAVVILDSVEQPSQEWKQIVAREFNYSETTFIHTNPTTTGDSDNNTSGPQEPSQEIDDSDRDREPWNAIIPSWRVDIFLTDAEVPFAGHPTIGTAVYALSTLHPAYSTPCIPTSNDRSSLAPLRRNDTSFTGTLKGRFELKAGTCHVSYQPSMGLARAAIPFATHLHDKRACDVAEIERLQPRLKEHLLATKQVLDEADIDVFSIVKGMTFVYIRLPSLDALAAVEVFAGDPVVKRDQGWDQGVLMLACYVAAPEEKTALAPAPGHEDNENVVLRTRMMGMNMEDPATGSASCGLGALLATKEGVKGRRRKYELVQAVEMGRRSEIGVEVEVDEKGKVTEIELVGSAVRVMSGQLEDSS